MMPVTSMVKTVCSPRPSLTTQAVKDKTRSLRRGASPPAAAPSAGQRSAPANQQARSAARPPGAAPSHDQDFFGVAGGGFVQVFSGDPCSRQARDVSAGAGGSRAAPAPALVIIPPHPSHTGPLSNGGCSP